MSPSMRAGSAPAAGSGSNGPGTEENADRPRSNDLGLELYRQRTLLQIMTARMRETAERLDRGGTVDLTRLRRALDVHHRYLLEVHLTDAERVARALARGKVEASGGILQELDKARDRGLEFERHAEESIARGLPPAGGGAHGIAQAFRAEAERIDQHQAWEADHLHARLDDWLPKPAQSRLLSQIRRFDSARVDAEIALISWASQHHPSAD